MRIPEKGWLIFNNNSQRWKLHLRTPFLKEKLNHPIRIRSGCNNQELPVTIIPTKPPADSEAIPVRLRPNPENGIKIGPIIGILSVSVQDQLKGNRANFKDIMAMGRKMGGICYVFTPEDIDWNNNEVMGRFYDRNLRKWIKSRMPMPDVVYNRIPNRTYEGLPEVIYTLDRLRKIPNLHLFNPHFFNKWEIIRILKNTPFNDILPETYECKDRSTFTEMLKKYRDVYLKPIDGKAGDGIYRLMAKEDGYFLYSAKDGKKITQKFEELDQVWEQIERLCMNREYLIQASVPLLTYRNSPFDVRILIQKNSQGEWDLSGIGIRVAGSHGITTHVPQGGKIISPEQAFEMYFSKAEQKALFNRIRRTAIGVAKSLEEHYGNLGEMSMDLGITRLKQIWFFEANAKPMKFDEKQIRQTSLRRIIEYSHFLSSFV
jgi:hypothetical protein